MEIKEKVTQEVEITKDIICNKCGNSCKGDVGNYNGLIEVVVTGAYDSTHLTDGKNYVFSMCEECLSEMIKTFSIPIDIQ